MTENGNPSSYSADTKANRGFRAGINGVKQNVTSLLDAGKVMTRLGPKQLKDEIAIAKIELKTKGIALGKGAAVAAVGLVFGLFLVISLVAAAILGLGKVMEPWLAALVLAAVFLVLLAIFALVGVKMIKSQLPVKPESALFGLLYDLGVLKHGSEMTSKRLKREQAEKAAAKEAEKENEAQSEEQKAPAAPAPSLADLKQRTKERREHLKSLRDDIDAYANGVQKQALSAKDAVANNVKNAPANTAASSRRLAQNAVNPQVVQSRWKSFTALLASLGAFFVFVSKFIKNR